MSSSQTSGATNDEQTLLVSEHGDYEEPSLAGSTISRYVVLEEVGRGAMGRVLRAYDPKLEREVALKVVRARSSDAKQRMVVEARAMAKLSHPNVVAVYDVEERGDDVVLVMEFVPGQTLRAWLEDEDRAWQDVVLHLLSAGRGLAAAHDAGLLHRDFKPSNVLVSSGGSVKVTDFGVAKLSGQSTPSLTGDMEVSDDSLTQVGTVLGTPRYMAPEQHRGEPLGAAADQYAFCVSLWEALCGEPPFLGSELAEQKASGPSAWPNDRVPGPIAAAVVRGLDPDPERRWPSMQPLLDTLAWDPSRRRTRWTMGAVGILGVGAVSYGVLATEGDAPCSGAEARLQEVWNDARRADVASAFENVGKAYANDLWGSTEQALDDYARDWAAMRTEACEATTIRGEQSPAMLDARMSCLDRAAVDFDAALEVLADADAAVVQKAHRVTGGLWPLARCADTEALAADVAPPLPEDAAAVKAARDELARTKTLIRAARFDAAKESVTAARDRLGDVAYGPVRTELALTEGNVFQGLGDYPPSEAALREALTLGARWQQPDETRLAALRLMFVVGARLKRPKEAMQFVPLAEGLSIGDQQREAKFHNTLAQVYLAEGKFADAEREHRLGLELLSSHPNASTVDLSLTRNNLANALQVQGKYDEAVVHLERALEGFRSTLGEAHPSVAQATNLIAICCYGKNDFDGAEKNWRSAYETWAAALGADHPNVILVRINLAVVLQHQGRLEEAEAEYRSALGPLEASLGPGHTDVASVRHNLAGMLAAQGKYAEAEGEYRTALEAVLAAQDEDHPEVARFRTSLATVLRRDGRLEESLVYAEQSWVRRQRDDMPAQLRAGTAFLLAELLWSIETEARDRVRARRLAEVARDAYAEAGEGFAEDLAEVETWLDENS